MSICRYPFVGACGDQAGDVVVGREHGEHDSDGARLLSASGLPRGRRGRIYVIFCRGRRLSVPCRGSVARRGDDGVILGCSKASARMYVLRLYSPIQPGNIKQKANERDVKWYSKYAEGYKYIVLIPNCTRIQMGKPRAIEQSRTRYLLYLPVFLIIRRRRQRKHTEIDISRLPHIPLLHEPHRVSQHIRARSPIDWACASPVKLDQSASPLLVRYLTPRRIRCLDEAGEVQVDALVGAGRRGLARGGRVSVDGGEVRGRLEELGAFFGCFILRIGEDG